MQSISYEITGKYRTENVSFHRNFVADFIRLKLTFILKSDKNRFLSHPLGDLWVTYALHL